MNSGAVEVTLIGAPSTALRRLIERAEGTLSCPVLPSNAASRGFMSGAKKAKPSAPNVSRNVAVMRSCPATSFCKSSVIAKPTNPQSSARQGRGVARKI